MDESRGFLKDGEIFVEAILQLKTRKYETSKESCLSVKAFYAAVSQDHNQNWG